MIFRVPAHQVSDKQKKLMRDILLENIICFETMDNIKYRMKRLFFDLENYKKSKKNQCLDNSPNAGAATTAATSDSPVATTNSAATQDPITTTNPAISITTSDANPSPTSTTQTLAPTTTAPQTTKTAGKTSLKL
ncbi:hypothetical protein G6F57_003954 [Rhizopus arrhizus]|uniref:Uncharacterized protein n=1 Tax=Rhizopus oryzae TaxID=64495 RepID=A0A9P7BSQ3_RHIOR|nr:hypothetical protein G6F23_008987 [Rhizopus arrhizus]KAG1427658.1 hypothetical protein G6F58_000934 [Rhizopus delemar]KAG0755953.1 hypothetical protein G6F24_011483 [Rhizopus arrhizus]KAG0785897.1 hypothetical protein G6F22_007797 [Rhizopus arrhizus]KAG0790430.1 hypothetical protein G6F21_005817 [Rhizopus arrhizus]